MKKFKFIFILMIFYLPALSQIKSDSLNSIYQNTRDTIGAFIKVDKEASFPGGDAAWRIFLEQNVDLDSAIKDLPKKKSHYKETVIIQFIVCIDGVTCDVKTINKVLPSARNEAERLIKKSGNWIPALINGKAVKAYRKQPMTFIYDEY